MEFDQDKWDKACAEGDKDFLEKEPEPATADMIFLQGIQIGLENVRQLVSLQKPTSNLKAMAKLEEMEKDLKLWVILLAKEERIKPKEERIKLKKELKKIKGPNPDSKD